jgi:Phage integrase family
MGDGAGDSSPRHLRVEGRAQLATPGAAALRQASAPEPGATCGAAAQGPAQQSNTSAAMAWAMKRRGSWSLPRSSGRRVASTCSAPELSASVARWGSYYVVTDGMGGQTSTWAIERAMRAARPHIVGLPKGFRFHDLRHYLASLLIGSGLDVKVVQHRLRHGSKKTTLGTYGHLRPDSHAARATVGAVLAARAEDTLRTGGPPAREKRRSPA